MVWAPVAGRKLRHVAPEAEDSAANGVNGVAALQRVAGRNPMLSRILATLQNVALTAVWQVRQ